MPETMLLIPGRSNKQGTSLNKGKLKEEYLQVTSTVEMNEEDMLELFDRDNEYLSDWSTHRKVQWVRKLISLGSSKSEDIAE